jgi:hypothetical protein
MVNDPRIRSQVKGLILVTTVIAAILYIARPSPEMRKGSDFADFYAAAQMVRHGQGHHLFDIGTQYQFQSRYLDRVGSYYIHPPFELLPYLLLTGLSLQHAFLFWSLWNGILLIATAWILSQHVFRNWNWHLLTGLSLLFVPLLLDFVQGQDSLALLLILVLAFIAILAKKEFQAGCLLACGLFKFHLVLPLVLILGFSYLRKARFFDGFVLIAILLLAISLSITGWGLFASYPQLLLGLQYLPLGGAYPPEMANLRGLFALLFHGHSLAALVATLACSLLLLWTTIGEWRQAAKADEKILALTFANSVLAAVMVGYHLSPHDLTLLLLPLSLITGYVFASQSTPGWLRYWIIISEIVIFLPPLYLLLLRRHTYGYASIPILILFSATHLAIKRASPRLTAER